MKWTSLIIPSSLIYIALLGAMGCASSKADKKSADTRAENNQVSSPAPKNSNEMKISYTNKSSNVTMVVDINSQDVNLVMSGSPVPPPSPVAPQVQQSSKKTSVDSAAKEEEEKDKKENWDDVMDIAKGNDLTKGDMQQVLAEIRKAQEFFYQKRFPEALDMVKFSLQKQETSDGYALMGSILYMMDDMPAAKEAWLQSLRLNPDMPAVIQMLNKLKKANKSLEQN